MNWSAEEVARWLEVSHVHEETRQRLISSGISGKQLVSLEFSSLKASIRINHSFVVSTVEAKLQS